MLSELIPNRMLELIDSEALKKSGMDMYVCLKNCLSNFHESPNVYSRYTLLFFSTSS